MTAGGDWVVPPSFLSVPPFADFENGDDGIFLGTEQVPPEIVAFYGTATVIGVLLFADTRFDYNYIAYVNPLVGVSFLAFGGIESVGFVVQENFRLTPGGGLAPPARMAYVPTVGGMGTISNGTTIDTITATRESGRAAGTAGTTTSAAFANMPGSPSPTALTAKAYDSTLTSLEAQVIVSCFPAAADAKVEIAVLVNGVDNIINALHMNVVGSRYVIGGTATIAGLPGQTTYSAVLRWRRVSGAGTVTHNTDDYYSITVKEVTV